MIYTTVVYLHNKLIQNLNKMILTKIQIILSTLTGYDLNEKFVKKAINKMLNFPELIFIAKIEKELNWKLEPIRKNQYIVT